MKVLLRSNIKSRLLIIFLLMNSAVLPTGYTDAFLLLILVFLLLDLCLAYTECSVINIGLTASWNEALIDLGYVLVL